MRTWQRILLCVFVLALVLAATPMRAKAVGVPCSYMWRYAISYSEPPTNYLDPADVYPGYPSICTDLVESTIHYF